MGIQKLVKKLKAHLAKGKKKDKVSCERIDELLVALAKKEKKLEQKLAKEKDPADRKHLKIELKVARLQLKKGKERRRELEKKCR